jgi:hypothetical protein
MEKIYKFPIQPNHSFRINANFPATPLCVKTIFNIPYVYILINSDVEDVIERKFMVVATGEAFDSEDWEYLGTFLIDDGSLVFHVYKESWS